MDYEKLYLEAAKEVAEMTEEEKEKMDKEWREAFKILARMAAEKAPVAQLATGSDSANGLEHISTKELVEELRKRDCVTVKRQEMFEDIALTINGLKANPILLILTHSYNNLPTEKT